MASQGLWIVLSRDYPAISGLPDPFWSAVLPSWQWRYLLFPGHAAFESVLYWMAIVALFAALLGVFPRVACAVAGMLLYHLAPLESIIWTPSPGIRGLTITVPSLVLLSLSRCGDSLALRPHRRSDHVPDLSADYSWQLRLIQLLVCQMYLFSAIAKLETSGLAWISAENMRHWFLYLSQVPDTAVFTRPGAWVASVPALNMIAAAGTIIFEASFVTVMFSRTARRVLVPAAFAFHLGIVFTLNLTLPAMPLLLVFVNWDWLRDRIAVRPVSGDVTAMTGSIT